jgi:hypothetical protein
MTKFPKRITLDITDKDIRLGRRENCQLCPAARAAKRLRLAPVVQVSEDGVYFYSLSSGTLAVYDASKTLEKFIRRFDEGRPVKPLRVVLRKEWGAADDE